MKKNSRKIIAKVTNAVIPCRINLLAEATNAGGTVDPTRDLWFSNAPAKNKLKKLKTQSPSKPMDCLKRDLQYNKLVYNLLTFYHPAL